MPPHRRDPLSYYASSARTSPTCRGLRCTLPSAPRTPPQRAAHRQGTAAHVTARRRKPPRGRRFKAPRVCRTSSPPGTAAVRSLPLAAAAACEAHLHVVPTAQPRVSWPYTLQTAVDRAAAWSSHSRNLQLTLDQVYNSRCNMSTKEETFCKIKCSNCCSLRSTVVM